MSSSIELIRSGESQLKKSVPSIVGIGVSAGGLEALDALFSRLPPSTGMAFIVVQHLSPDFKSMLSELLQRRTEMPIVTVTDALEVEADKLYLMPAGKEMLVSGNKLLLTDRDKEEHLNLPIDHFFRSMAQDCGSRCIAVVMSGTGSDGSRGICEVHEEGGIVVCQSADSARFDGMPNSAQRTGVVDFVGTPEDIASFLIEQSVIPNPQRTHAVASSERLDELISPEFHHKLFQLLLDHHGIDFYSYKPNTIARRILSRAQNQFGGDLDKYLYSLENDTETLEQLYKDLLIGVTKFFRDRSSFERLQAEGIRRVIQNMKDGDAFRAWVAGCATGEEAYTLAILADETATELGKRIDIKVFGTDVHKASIDFAHRGVFSPSAVSELSDDRKSTYFRKTHGEYQVAPHLRGMLVFAVHNLIKDPPFTRMDVITCRNLLIYFKPSTQKKVLSFFHFSLNARGVLFLGSSESVGELHSEFDCIDDKAKIFLKRRDIRIRSTFVTDAGERRDSGNVYAARNEARSSERELNAELEGVLNHCLPPTVLVDSEMNVLRLFSGVGDFLHSRDGRLSTCILDMVTGDLRAAIVSAVKRAEEAGKRSEIRNVEISQSDTNTACTVSVMPIRFSSDVRRYAISFQNSQDSPGQSEHGNMATVEALEGSLPADRVAELERELLETKYDLRTAIDDNRSNSEALQTSNEELMAANEELQGANEELQSVNEELFTVNAEYQNKINELSELSNDMENLLLSTDVHTLFLDSDLRIRKFTPKFAEVFHLKPEDVRRPIQGFAHNIICEDLIELLTQVARTAETVQREVQDRSGQYFLMRILPYVASSSVGGVVFTLTNISSVVESQNEALAAASRFERAVAASSDGIWDWPDVNNDDMWWSPECYRLLGFEPGEIPSTYTEWSGLIHPVDRELMRETTIAEGKRCYIELHSDFEYRMRHKSGEFRWYRHRTMLEQDTDGKAIRITGSVSDIHLRKQAELQAQIEIERRDNFLAMLSHELRNPMAAVLSGVTLLRSTASENKPSEEESSEFLSIIERQVTHMARLLDGLLEVGRIHQNKIDYEMARVDLVELMHEVLKAVQHQMDEKHQHLHSSIPDGGIYVFADPDRLIQSQVNLLVNASKFSDEYSDIQYELDRDGDDAVIRISDTGRGIAEEELESIFDLFFQSGKSLDRKEGGMGLGLALTKSVVEAHGGSIFAASKGLDQGSTFTIHLPIVDFETERAVSKVAGNHSDLLHGTRVLLVEDNLDVLRMMKRQLSGAGIQVAAVSDGYEALDFLKSGDFDVGIIDIGLPGLDGYELTKKIRSVPDHKDKLLIAVTGYGHDQDRAKSKEAGFNHHLVKPVNTEQLFSVIADYRATHSRS